MYGIPLAEYVEYIMLRGILSLKDASMLEHDRT